MASLNSTHISKILEHYLREGGKIKDFVLINKKYSKPTSLQFYENKKNTDPTSLHFYKNEKWLLEFYDFYNKENFNELLPECFKKDGNLKSTHVRGVSTELRDLIIQLYNSPFNIEDVKSYNNFWDNIWEKWLSDLNVKHNLFMTFYINWYNRFSKEDRKKQFDSCFKNNHLILSSKVTSENIELHYILNGLNIKTKEDYRNLLPKINDFKSKLIELYPNEFKKKPIKRKPTDVVVSKAKYTDLNELQTSIEPMIRPSAEETTTATNSAATSEDELKEDQEAARDEFINRPKPAQEDDGYDNATEYFDDYENYFDSDFNSIPTPDYSSGVVLKQDHNGNPLITANLSGKERKRKERINQVSNLFEEHFLNKDIENVVYRFHFRGVGWRTYKLKSKEQMEKMLDSVKKYGASNVEEVSYSASSSYYEQHEIPKIQFVDYLRIEVENFVIKDGKKGEKKTKGGEFFPYRFLPEYCFDKGDETLILAQIVLSLSNYQGKERDIFQYNCFCYALLQSGKISKKIIDQIQSRCYGVYVKIKDVKEICKDLNIKINLTEYTPNNQKNKFRKHVINPEGTIEVDLGLFRTETMKGDHYFINCLTPYSTFYLKHRQEIINYAIDNDKDITRLLSVERYDNRRNCYCSNGKNVKYATMFEYLVYVWEHNGFYAYSLNDTLNIYSNFDRYVVNKEIEFLEYNDNCVRPIKAKAEKKESDESKYEYFYADFEAATQGFHKPYAIAFISRIHSEEPINFIYGFDCEEKFLDELKKSKYTPIVYFHNLAYDGRFLAKYGIRKAIKKAGKILSMELQYKGKRIILRDSYSMITSPLKDFPSMFDIKDVVKEIYPYNYYTEERVNSNIGIIDEAGKYETVPWSEEDYNLFKENIDKIPGCRIDENHFKMDLYCGFYCKQDVNILMMGHMKFKELVERELKLDIDEVISISSLANKYFTNNIYSQIPNLYEYSGHVRKFIQGCVKGGRCMTRQNKKWYCNERLYDYDACSLYPSAVHRLKLATGTPKVIPKGYLGKSKKLFEHLMGEQQLIPTKERFVSAFIVDIEITKVGKELAFPIIMQKTKKGNLNCNECCEMRVDNIELEDLIKYHQIEFIIKRGYYWSGPKSDLFSKEMKRIYDLRVAYKKQKNPLQLVLKLLMNSTYGKTIQLEIKTEQVYCYNTAYRKDKKGKTIKVHEAARFNKKNNKNIKEYYAINKNITCFEVEKGFDDFYVPNFIGVQILSMSKRIMNEVMCLAEDLGIMIYYQDTDSMHIPVKDVPKLEQKFKDIYKRDLRGSDMGQFHPDFESNKIKGELQSVESYFLGKKAYCDKLQNENGEVDYHLRMKGIPNELLASEYEDPLELYQKLYNGEPYTFNLLKLRPSFEMNKDMTIKTRTEFTRQIKFD